MRSSAAFCCAWLGFFAALVAGCTPVYTSETYSTSTPRTQSLDLAKLTSGPVAVLGLITPANLAGFAPTLSHALISALTKARPPIRVIPPGETVSTINEQGLTRDYEELLAGFTPGGILERERLRAIGSVLASRYLLLPGMAEFNQLIMDKYEVMAVKLVRTRVTTLRLWLQLWDAQTGRILWESAGELTAATALLNAKRTVPLDELAQKLWLQMIQEDFSGRRPKRGYSCATDASGGRTARKECYHLSPKGWA